MIGFQETGGKRRENGNSASASVADEIQMVANLEDVGHGIS